MNFHETVRGKVFFEVQVPKLISALQDIAAALERRPQALGIPRMEIQPHLLRDLYYGEYEPYFNLGPTAEYQEANGKVLAQQERLQAKEDPGLRDEVEQLISLINARTSVELEQAFGAGYRCAVQLLMAGLLDPGQDRNKEETSHDRESV